MSKQILVVDDEPDLVDLVCFNLSEAGYRSESAFSGREAVEKLARSRPDLLILDLMLPDVGGTEICRKVRADPKLRTLPVLMLTARSEEVDRVVGFEVGADDYLTKPFSPRELVLRVRALLRRAAGDVDAGSQILEQGPLHLDLERHRCRVAGEEVELTAKEFQLLETLMRAPGRVQTRERLLDTVWGTEVTVTSRTIDTHLKRLREKLGVAGELIETVRGIGYRFVERRS
ncbi:MAG: response regulator transcription factor [Myxococcota bacterium]